VKDFGNLSDDIVCNCEIDTVILLVFLFRSEKFTLRSVGGGGDVISAASSFYKKPELKRYHICVLITLLRY
jgi:hypothetical protein